MMFLLYVYVNLEISYYDRFVVKVISFVFLLLMVIWSIVRMGFFFVVNIVYLINIFFEFKLVFRLLVNI